VVVVVVVVVVLMLMAVRQALPLLVLLPLA
jgi:hypothetical protein